MYDVQYVIVGAILAEIENVFLPTATRSKILCYWVARLNGLYSKAKHQGDMLDSREPNPPQTHRKNISYQSIHWDTIHLESPCLSPETHLFKSAVYSCFF